MKLVTEQDLVSAIPVKELGMTREQKLLHWASLIRNSVRRIHLYHNLEHMDIRRLADVVVSSDFTSAFSIARENPVFQAEGLSPEANIPDVMKFMDLTFHELHEFSCDCGGMITKDMMVERIERLVWGR
jgi:hypothetical protein